MRVPSGFLKYVLHQLSRAVRNGLPVSFFSKHSASMILESNLLQSEVAHGVARCHVLRPATAALLELAPIVGPL